MSLEESKLQRNTFIIYLYFFIVSKSKIAYFIDLMLQEHLNLTNLYLTSDLSDLKLESQEIAKIESETLSLIYDYCHNLTDLTIW